MKRIVAALCLLFCFSLPQIAHKVPGFASIMPLQVWSDGEMHNICTTEKISSDDVWLTAAHCVVEDDGSDGVFYIDKQPAVVKDIDQTNDIALLQAKQTASEPLKLAKKEPQIGDKLTIPGYPRGIGPVLLSGSKAGNVEADGRNYQIFSLGTCGGNSGSPVLDKHDELVSVLQIGFSPTCSPVTGGVGFVELKQFLSKWLH